MSEGTVRGDAYAITPAGVVATLRTVSTEAGDLATLAKPLARSGAELDAATGQSQPVSAAWADFWDVQSTRLTGITTLVDACLTNGSAAALAYVRGDEEMAREHQAKVVEAGVGLPGWVAGRTDPGGRDG